NVFGSVDVIGGSAEVELVRTGFFVVETGGGDVHVTAISEGDIYTGGGSAHVDLVETIEDGELYIETRSGNIHLDVPRGVGLTFDFDVYEGFVEFDAGGEYFTHAPDLEYQDRFSIRGGGMRITLITDTGSIYVRD